MDPNKDKNEPGFMYKSCTTRSDRDAYRICPSKLTKRELEDLYFTLLEENMEQKKTINRQHDRIKMLSTRVQRMYSAQKDHQDDERKDCCVISNCKSYQHKQSLADLRRTNEQMAERIRQLNAQLTAARQISKSKLSYQSKCPKLSSATSPNLAELSQLMSKYVYYPKSLHSDMSGRSVEIQTVSASLSQACEENKCRTLMEELKQKIVNLEEELVNTHNEYSNRMNRLESKVLQSRNQEVLVRHESVVIEPESQQTMNLTVVSLGTGDELNDLKRQLMLEKKKVAELETRLKAAAMSSTLSKTIDEHLPTIQEQLPEENKDWEKLLWECTCGPVCPHTKPVCTLLRLFNRGLLSSTKYTPFGENKPTTNVDDVSVHEDVNMRQSLADITGHKDLTGVEHKDLVDEYRHEHVFQDKEHNNSLDVKKKESSDKKGREHLNIQNYEDISGVECNLPKDRKDQHVSKEESSGENGQILPDNKTSRDQPNVPQSQESVGAYKDPIKSQHFDDRSNYSDGISQKTCHTKKSQTSFLMGENDDSYSVFLNPDVTGTGKKCSINYYHKCGCRVLDRVSNVCDSNVSTKVPQVLPGSSKGGDLPVTHISQSLSEADKIPKNRVNDNRQDLTNTNGDRKLTSSNVKKDVGEHPPGSNERYKHRESQVLSTSDRIYSTWDYNNSQEYPYTDEIDNQTINDKDETEHGVNRTPNLPDTNEIQAIPEADVIQNIRTYDNSKKLTSSTVKKEATQQKSRNNGNPHLSDTQRQSLTDADTIHNISVYDNSHVEANKVDQPDSSTKKDIGQTQLGVNMDPSLPNRQALPLSDRVEGQADSCNVEKKDIVPVAASRHSVLSNTHQSHGLIEADMFRNIGNNSNSQDLIYTMEVPTSFKENKIIAQDQPNPNVNQDLPDTHEDLHKKKRLSIVYACNNSQDSLFIRKVQNATNSNTKEDLIAQAEPIENKSPSRGSRVSMGLTEADMIRNIRTYNISQDSTDLNVLVNQVHPNLRKHIDKNQPSESHSQALSDSNKDRDLPEPDKSKGIHDPKESTLNPNASPLQNLTQARPGTSRNQGQFAAGKHFPNASPDQDLHEPKNKKNIESRPDDSRKLGVLDPYSIKDPSELAKNLANISKEQQETIDELKRQLFAKKKMPLSSDKVDLSLGEYFNTDEDDINSIPFNQDPDWSKQELEPTKVPVKDKMAAGFTSRLRHDSVWPRNEKQDTSTKDGTNGTKSTAPKNDRHNSLQIPGPIPPNAIQTSNWKTNVFKRFNRDNKKRNSKENNKKTKDMSSNTGDEIDKKQEFVETSTVTEGNNFPESTKHKHDCKTEQITTKVRKSLLKRRKDAYHDGLNSPVRPVYNRKDSVDPGALMVRCMELNMIPVVETVEEDVQVKLTPDLTATQKLETSVDVPLTKPREVKTYRSEDGTLCFETKPLTDRTRCCQCNRQFHCEDYTIKGDRPVDEPQNMHRYEQGTSTSSRKDGLQCMALEQAQYVMPASQTKLAETPKTPPSSPTSHIEYSTDTKSTVTSATVAPTAIEGKSLSATTPIEKPGSSGVHKDKGTKIESTSTKIPASNISKDVHTTATATTNSNDMPKENLGATATRAKSMQIMEEKLQALTDELARCKELLRSQQLIDDHADSVPTREKRSTSSESDEKDRKLALKRGVAMHTIGDTYTPRCVFMLHVGTVVLSDEAVRSTRDKSLILTWKFYNQNESITRMSAGRVMLFDFSSEYDIQLTDEFIKYMKFEEMVISICELDNHSESFATCALPLREALLHTNRRADLSLELVAGPQMLHARKVNNTSDSLDPGDEVGVIDLWCMLRVDTKALPIINKAIARPSMPAKIKEEQRIIHSLIDVDEDDEEDRATLCSQGKFEPSFQEMRDLDSKNLHRWGSSILRLPSRDWTETKGDDKTKKQQQKKVTQDVKKQKPNQRDSKIQKRQMRTSAEDGTRSSCSSLTTQYFDPNKYPLHNRRKTKEELVMEQGQGGILINEVIANIKTPEDMKQAMENTYRNSIHLVSRLPRNEDDIVSQAHSGSSYNFIRTWLHRKGSDKASAKSGTGSSTKSRRKYQDFQPALVLPEAPSENDSSIYRKYDNISKLYSSKSDIKKQVKIHANTKYGNNASEEEPQKDEDDSSVKEEAQTVDITILWLALNEECEAMCNPRVQKVYVAYSFLGKFGAELETPFSLPKPKHHVDKCYFNFKKTFEVEEDDISLLGHMARCRAASRVATDFKDCIVFSVISEPPEDPLGLDTCEDIGYAYLYLGDLLAYSAGSPGYTEVIPVRARGGSSVCGVLAVRLDGLDVLRRCAALTAGDCVPHID